MKRPILLVFACASFFTLGITYLQSSKAQIRFETPTAQDIDLASDIRKVTNRSPEGLVVETHPDGGIMVDFQGRFQNVVIAKFDADEGMSTGCVTSHEEANGFFGKNLETGEIYPRDKNESEPRRERTHPRGMSKREFDFYTKLIEDARNRRLENPNAATLAIVNNDGAGEGFNDTAPRTPEGGNTGTTLGQQRLNLFNFAGQIWGAYLDSSVTTNIRSQFDPQTCTQTSVTLGSAGALSAHTSFANAEFRNTFYHAALANKAAGSDLSPNPEINATFNSNIDNGCFGGAARWYYGFDSAGPGNTEDLLLTVLHELGHGLGFSSFVNGSTGALFNNIPDIYTRNMFDRTTGMYWHEMTNAQRQTSALNNGNVFWDGPNVKVASGFLTAGREPATGRVQLFTPTTLQGGSSISHYGTNTFPNLLMEPFSALGISLDLDLTRQQMRDIGWYADSGADLVPDAITGILPSGSTLVPGTNATITWVNGGGFNRSVSIDLSTDGGTTFTTTIASNIPNTGAHLFTVPNVSTSQGRIRVREHDFVQPSGVSAANLTIGSGGPTATPTPPPNPGATTTVSYSGPVVPIPDNSAVGTNMTVSFSGIGTISDLDFRFGGTAPSSDPLSTTVGVNHSWIGDLVFKLTSPAGTTVTFFERPGVPALGSGCNGNNLFSLTLNDDGGLPPVEGQCPAGGDNGGPLTGNFSPNNPFSVFDGQNANGTWTLNASDNAGQDVGSVRAFSLLITAASVATPTPTPPTPTQTPTPTPPPAGGRTAFDYDGDRRTDISIYRPSIGDWHVQGSQNGLTGIRFGLITDRIVPADFDGDGRTDVAVYRPSDGTWYIVRSSDGTFMFAVFGLPNDIPMPGDFDGDGRADISVFRPSDSTWYRLNSSNQAFFGRQFGAAGDRPLMGDFDGDGRADLAVFRPSIGAWFQIRSQTDSFFGEQFGALGDVLVPADYDGDRKTDLAVYRPSNGSWFIKPSLTGTFTQTQFGAATDIAAPGDYDGDGRADICVFRPSEGQWYRTNSSNGMFNAFPFGIAGDRPTQSAFH